MPEQYYYVVERQSYKSMDAALERAKEIDGSVTKCQACERISECGGFGPTHCGSASCQSGSIASGGRNAHCTCDRCF